jgi:hypothetical protein
MSRTYKAVLVTKPDTLELIERPIVEPAFGQVRIRVEACGICHPFEMRQKLKALFDVLPFSMGPIGSPLSQIGVQLTDSPYIVRPRMMPPRSPAPTRV